MKKKTITAILLTTLAVLMTPMTALAYVTDTVTDIYSGDPITIHDDIVIHGDKSAISVRYKSVEVEGNVKKEIGRSEDLVHVEGGNIHVSITGNAENNDGRVIVLSGNGSAVSVGGDVKSGNDNAIYAKDGSLVTVNGNVSGGSCVSASDSEVNVKGKLTSLGSVSYTEGVSANNSVVTADSIEVTRTGIEAKGSKTNVKIAGKVESSSAGFSSFHFYAVEALDGAHVDVGSAKAVDTAVNASGKDTVVIVRDTATTTGSGQAAAIASDGAQVEVKKIIGTSNADAAYSNNDALIIAKEIVNEKGNGANASSGIIKTGSVISAGNALTASGDGCITVTGDASSTGSTVFNASAGSTIVVEGTAKGKTGTFSDDSSLDATIIVYEIDLVDGEKDTRDIRTKALFESAYYIIKNDSNIGSFTLSSAFASDIGTYTDDKGNVYQTARETGTEPSDIVINVAKVEGYKFKSFGKSCSAFVQYNEADKSYTLIVPRGGGVSLELIYEAIGQASGGRSSSSEHSGEVVTLGTPTVHVGNGSWTEIDGVFKYMIDGKPVKNAMVWITYVPSGQTNPVSGCFYFDKYGNMRTGWQEVSGKWYYFNDSEGATRGMMLVNTTTPDGKTVGADGARI